MLGGPSLTPEVAAALTRRQTGRPARPAEDESGEPLRMIGLTFDTGALIALERRPAAYAGGSRTGARSGPADYRSGGRRR